MAVRRLSAISKRLSKMRGLPYNEKQMLVRIGETIDAAINNRTPTNPNLDGRFRSDPRLPPPRNVLAQEGVRSVKLEWPAVDSSILANYEILVTNLDTGVTERKVSFTNELVYKGRIGGNYEARVRSVGRNNTKSDLSKIEFFVSDDVMLLEGAKNGATTVSETVSEDIRLFANHKIFIWGSFTIDKLIAGGGLNSSVTLQLLRGPEGSTIDNATLVEQITMFAATESAANYDSTALGGGIFRPATTEGDLIRSSTFETSQSVMFSPFAVPDDEGETTNVFFIRAINRETEDDIADLAITLFSAFEGTGDQVPSDPFSPDPAIVTDDRNSIEFYQNDHEYVRGIVTQPFRLVGGFWTFACWFKLDRIGGSVSIAGGRPGFALADRVGIAPAFGTNFGQNVNSISIRYFPDTQLAAQVHRMDVSLGGKSSTGNPGTSSGSGLWRKTVNTNEDDVAETDSSPLLPNGIDDWHFLVITYQNGVGATVYINASEQSPDFDDTDTIEMDTGLEQNWFFGADGTSLLTNGIYDGPDPSSNPTDGENMDGKIHSAGFWNRALTLAEITELYNSGDGADIHWLNDGTSYLGSGNLVHYWQFGAVKSDLFFVGRDTGLSPPGGRANTTDTKRTVNLADDEFSNNFKLRNVQEGVFPGGSTGTG